MIRRLTLFSVLVPLLISTTRCSSSRSAKGTLQVWVHAGQESERQVIAQQAQRFNALHQSTPVRLTFIPEGSYNAQV